MAQDMKRLARMFDQLQTDIARCSRCGMCQGVCPLYGQTRNESDVARGKLALLDALGHQVLDRADGVLDRLNRCLLCGSCAAACPNSVDGMSIFLKARAILTAFVGLSPAKKLLFKKMVSHPETFEKWLHTGKGIQKWLVRPESELLGTVSMRFSNLLGKRHFLPLAGTSFYEGLSLSQLADSKTRTEVLFYPGCLINHVFPNVGNAALSILGKHNIDVKAPQMPVCCGMPAMSAGDTDTARKLMYHNLSQLEKYEFDHVVTACPTCAYAIKKVWPMLLNADDGPHSHQLDHLAACTVDISEYALEKGLLPSPLPHPQADAAVITYHDPCHLKKSLKVADAPRAMITANPAYRLAEMARADVCCGMGGSFGIAHYDLSDEIADNKLAHITATGCTTVATGCPACMLQISHALSKAGCHIFVKHPVEIFAEIP